MAEAESAAVGAEATFTVVRNDEDQYSIVPVTWRVPEGWHPVGVTGPIAECEAHVESVWTDLRPLSQRTRPA